jgi:superfamily II DNA/RNA helicase
LRDSSKHVQSASGLLISNLQQRLLSSIPAFARTLAVHKRYLRKEADQHAPVEFPLLANAISSDDEHASLPAADLAKEEDSQMGAATVLSSQHPLQAELDLVDRMESIAQASRYQPDARVRYLYQWILDHCITAKQWNHRRVIVFTTYEDTLLYLRNQLEDLLAPFGDPERRIQVYRGETNRVDRQSIKDAFNAPPDRHPIRILLATDAAREGLNLQAHCADLFHLDVPWNPARLEQRSGRIDRKLQPSPEVRCYYFNYTQRPEDRILSTLVRKVETIREELGSLSQGLESRLTVTHLRRDALADIERDMVPPRSTSCGSRPSTAISSCNASAAAKASNHASSSFASSSSPCASPSPFAKRRSVTRFPPLSRF